MTPAAYLYICDGDIDNPVLTHKKMDWPEKYPHWQEIPLVMARPAQQEPVAWAWLKDETPVNVFLTRGDADDPYWQDKGYSTAPLYTSPQSKPWVGLVHEETHEAIGTAGVDLLELAKMWSDNKIHVYQFDNEARKIIEVVLRRASAKLREKNT